MDSLDKLAGADKPWPPEIARDISVAGRPSGVLDLLLSEKAGYPAGGLLIPFDEGSGTTARSDFGDFTLYEDSSTVHTSPSGVWTNYGVDLVHPEHARSDSLDLTVDSLPFTVVLVMSPSDAEAPTSARLLFDCAQDLSGSSPRFFVGYRDEFGPAWWHIFKDSNGNATELQTFNVTNDWCVVFYVIGNDVSKNASVRDREVNENTTTAQDNAGLTTPQDYPVGTINESTAINASNDQVDFLDILIYPDKNLLATGEDRDVLSKAKKRLSDGGITYSYKLDLETGVLNDGTRQTLSEDGYARSVINLTSSTEPRITRRTVGGTEYDLAAFYDDDEETLVAIREKGGTWSVGAIDQTVFADGLNPGTDQDPHRSVMVDVDDEGYVHIIGGIWTNDISNHHRRSDAPIGSWDQQTTTAVTSYDAPTGTDTYPRSTRTSDGTLWLTWRVSGNSGDADQAVAYYDSGTDNMAAAFGTSNGLITETIAGDADDETSVYVDGIRADDNDQLHLIFNWRKNNGPNGGGIKDSFRQTELIVDATQSPEVLKAHDGTTFTPPVTYTDVGGTAAVIDDIQDAGLNYSSQVALDGNKPLVVKQIADGGGEFELFLYHYDGASWNKQQVTDGSGTTSDPRGDGTGYPSMCVLSNGTAYIFGKPPSKVDFQVQRWVSNGTDYTSWTQDTPIPYRLIFDAPKTNLVKAESQDEVEVFVQAYESSSGTGKEDGTQRYADAMVIEGLSK